MPELPSAEENIDRLISHFMATGQSPRIRDWRQQIEDEEAATAGRPTETVPEEKAIQDFQDGLLDRNHYGPEAAALLADLQRPSRKQLSAKRAWELQDPERRPSNLTPTEQAYCNQFDHAEAVRAKWDVPLSEERRLNWGKLAKAGKWKDLAADQAELFESWLRNNPERANDLLPGIISSSNPVDRTRLPPKAYHPSGLFWLTANVLFKMYGFDDRVATPIIQRLESTWSKWKKEDSESVTAGVALGYAMAIRQLAKEGAHCIEQLDHYLLTTVRRKIIKERQKERRSRPPEKQYIDDLAEEDSPRASKTDAPDAELTLVKLIQAAPDRCQPYLRFMVENSDATDKEAAAELGCSTRTIERYRKQLHAIYRR